MKPTVDDYRPDGNYYQSVIICFEGNESCRPINIPYPPSEELVKLAKRSPFFQALIEEQERRVAKTSARKQLREPSGGVGESSI